MSKIPFLAAFMSDHASSIETWFEQQFLETPAPITASVDVRYAGFKVAPVDTNLFPAGFNNLSSARYPHCIAAMKNFMEKRGIFPARLLIVTEEHTRNSFYTQSVDILCSLWVGAGWDVRTASLSALIRVDQRIGLDDFDPDIILLNNDLSAGIPNILVGLEQSIQPSPLLGWSERSKMTHFAHYKNVAEAFAEHVACDPWLISPLSNSVQTVDFLNKTGVEQLVSVAETMLKELHRYYAHYGINTTPFLVVKADNGTYGMNVMMIEDPNEILDMNRKKRTKMAVGKSGQRVHRVLLQEGIYTCDRLNNLSVAEPVMYLIGSCVVGGFYRAHNTRKANENLNATGMYFESFHEKNMSEQYYMYSVVARLAALAAGHEIKAIGA